MCLHVITQMKLCSTRFGTNITFEGIISRMKHRMVFKRYFLHKWFVAIMTSVRLHFSMRDFMALHIHPMLEWFVASGARERFFSGMLLFVNLGKDKQIWIYCIKSNQNLQLLKTKNQLVFALPQHYKYISQLRIFFHPKSSF